jgi:hypothetical protein
MAVCFFFCIFIQHFSLTEQMSQPSEDVSLNIESGMDSENVGAV